MRASWISKVVVLALAACLSACGAVTAQREASRQKEQQFVQRVDIAHIWVTNGAPPPGKPFAKLGDIKFTEPFSPEVNDEAHMRDKIKQMAYEQYPNDIDAVIQVHSDISDDGKNVVVSGEAIKYDSSTDRTALHKMTEGMVASPK
jgi:hypothetical protein